MATNYFQKSVAQMSKRNLKIWVNDQACIVNDMVSFSLPAE